MYCYECGKEFEAQDKRIRLCPDCREERNKKKVCIVCGIELSGNARKYCTTCRKAVKLKQIQRAMDKKHHIALNKDIYNNFKKYFKKPTEEIEKLMLASIEEVCKH